MPPERHNLQVAVQTRSLILGLDRFPHLHNVSIDSPFVEVEWVGGLDGHDDWMGMLTHKLQIAQKKRKQDSLSAGRFCPYGC